MVSIPINAVGDMIKSGTLTGLRTMSEGWSVGRATTLDAEGGCSCLLADAGGAPEETGWLLEARDESGMLGFAPPMLPSASRTLVLLPE